MMLLYGFFCSISALLRRVAEWKHGRAQSAYEAAEAEFGKLETGCKAFEVSLGRPVDYAEQLQLLKAYERRELAKTRWVAAAHRMNHRQAMFERLRRFSELRLPYTFGLIDMACLMRALDHFGLMPHIEGPVLETVYAMLLH